MPEVKKSKRARGQKFSKRLVVRYGGLEGRGKISNMLAIAVGQVRFLFKVLDMANSAERSGAILTYPPGFKCFGGTSPSRASGTRATVERPVDPSSRPQAIGLSLRPRQKTFFVDVLARLVERNGPLLCVRAFGIKIQTPQSGFVSSGITHVCGVPGCVTKTKVFPSVVEPIAVDVVNDLPPLRTKDLPVHLRRGLSPYGVSAAEAPNVRHQGLVVASINKRKQSVSKWNPAVHRGNHMQPIKGGQLG